MHDQSAAQTSRQTSRTYQVPTGYNSRTPYSVARGYRHYYDYQPSIWPYGLPYHYLYMGMMYNLMWSPLYHSYGWYGPGQQWVYYDSVSGGAAQGQIDQTQMVDQSGQPVRTVVVQRDNGSGFVLFMIVLFILIVSVIVGVWWWRRRSSVEVVETEPANTSYLPPVEPKKTFLKQSGLDGLRVGETITLTDPISLKDARVLNPKSKGLRVIINQILAVREKDDACAWTFLYGTSEFEQQEVLIKVKDVGGQRSCVCYTRDVEGTRQDLLDGGARFLFSQPETEAFDPSDLRYSQSFERDLSGDGADQFGMIQRHELHGSATYRGPSSFKRDLLATVAEWRNARRPTNEYLALETGTRDSSNVEGWWGDSLAVADLRFPS